MAARREPSGIPGARGWHSLTDVRDVGPDLQAIRLAADVRETPATLGIGSAILLGPVAKNEACFLPWIVFVQRLAKRTITMITMITTPTIPIPPIPAASMCLPSENRSIARLGSHRESRCGAPLPDPTEPGCAVTERRRLGRRGIRSPL